MTEKWKSIYIATGLGFTMATAGATDYLIREHESSSDMGGGYSQSTSETHEESLVVDFTDNAVNRSEVGIFISLSGLLLEVGAGGAAFYQREKDVTASRLEVLS